MHEGQAAHRAAYRNPLAAVAGVHIHGFRVGVPVGAGEVNRIINFNGGRQPNASRPPVYIYQAFSADRRTDQRLCGTFYRKLQGRCAENGKIAVHL